MRRIARHLSSKLRTAPAALAVLGLAAVCTTVLPSSPASAATTGTPTTLSQAVKYLESHRNDRAAGLVRVEAAGEVLCLAADIPIRSVANGMYLSAELVYTGDQYGMLRARTDAAPGPWERFTFEPFGNGYAIRAVSNGKYVSAELAYSGDWYGVLRARANGVGPWEQFR